jgi:hypothetical protein
MKGKKKNTKNIGEGSGYKGLLDLRSGLEAGNPPR